MSGISFPVACPYVDDNESYANRYSMPSSPGPSMPIAQPFQHVVYPSSTPATFEQWQDNNLNARAPDAWIPNQQRTQLHSPPQPTESPSLCSHSSAPQRTASPESYDSGSLSPHQTYTAFPPASPGQHSPSLVEGYQANVGVGGQRQRQTIRQLTADDIRPNDATFSKLSTAVKELETCKTIFEQCDERFVTEFMNIFPKESLEFRVQSKTDELKNSSAEALTTAYEIHEIQKSFARSVVTKLTTLSRSPGGGTLLPDQHLDDLWANIQSQTSRITELTGSLRSSILDLSRLIYQAKDKYEARHFRKKLWEWLVRFFEAIANALGFARHGIAAALGNAGIIGAAVGANRQSLIKAASAICKEIKDYNGKQEQGFQKALGFLSAELPTSIKKAEISLTDYNAVQEMQREDIQGRREGLRGNMTAEEATRALRDWETFSRRA
ncbi:hypothetical protein SCHPADRAFT_939880 [Schizopora paradoxa]|uniref:Uncharacterized protein n=1 Tax=Schizopora paradoxa TaxID=27342 RepID=A0A0H2RPW7_9AGAM|nr:hypothetical protein SCHPADRAFT_939880 [Schizopora paradoxa]